MFRTSRFVIAVVLALALATTALADFVTTSNPVHPSGTRAQVDLPTDQHMRNVGGSDGAGLCVGTSIEVAAHWQNLPELDGFQKWLQRRPGGSYPEMLARDLKLFTDSKGVKLPPHIQHTGGDIEFLRLAFKTRRAVGMTYAGYDNFYGNQMIAHMVTGAHLDDKVGAVIDNNQPGKWRWMSDTQLINRWLGKTDDGRNLRVGGGWAVVWLTSPPPPVDTTASDFIPERPIVAEEETFHAENFPTNAEPMEFAAPLDMDKDKLFPNGYDPDMLKPKMRYWIDGEECSRPKALDTLKRFGSEFSDDSKRAFVSVVTDDAAVAAAVKKALAPYADKLHINVYKSDSWVVKSRLSAKIVAQLPADQGGKTVYKSNEVDAVSAIAAAKAALGIVDPPPAPVMPAPVQPGPVQPVKPDDKKPDDAAPSAPSVKNKLLFLLAGLAALIFLMRRQS